MCCFGSVCGRTQAQCWSVFVDHAPRQVRFSLAVFACRETHDTVTTERFIWSSRPRSPRPRAEIRRHLYKWNDNNAAVLLSVSAEAAAARKIKHVTDVSGRRWRRTRKYRESVLLFLQTHLVYCSFTFVTWRKPRTKNKTKNRVLLFDKWLNIQINTSRRNNPAIQRENLHDNIRP